MNRRQLRARLAKQWRLPEVPDPVWDDLDEDGYVNDALGDPVEGWDNFAQVARRRYRLFQAGAGRRTVSPKRARVQAMAALSAYEAVRAQVVSEYAARLADTPRVRQFRAGFSDGEPLTEAEARAFVESPALAYFRRQQLERWGVPLLGHAATLESAEHSQEGDWLVEQFSVRIDPPGETYSARRRSNSGLGFPPEYLTVPSEDGWIRRLPVARGSVLDELHGLAVGLAERYGWEQAAAAWFVLTGAIPLLAPIKIGIKATNATWRDSGGITLEIEPWVPAETVQRVYRRIQQQMVGGENRPLKLKTLAVFRFVTERTQVAGRRPPWQRLMTDWNNECAAYQEDLKEHVEERRSWRYDNWRALARDFGRAARALLFPVYDIPTGDSI